MHSILFYKNKPNQLRLNLLVLCFLIQLATTRSGSKCTMVPVSKKNWSWPTFEGLEAAGGSWRGQRPSGTTRDQCCGQKEPFEPKKFLASAGLWWPRGRWRVLGGPDTVRDHQGSMLWSKGTVWAKKISALTGLWWPRGRWRGRRPSGTIRDWHWGQKESFEPKKNLASAGLRWPLEATWCRNLGWPSYFWASLDLSFP